MKFRILQLSTRMACLAWAPQIAVTQKPCGEGQQDLAIDPRRVSACLTRFVTRATEMVTSSESFSDMAFALLVQAGRMLSFKIGRCISEIRMLRFKLEGVDKKSLSCG